MTAAGSAIVLGALSATRTASAGFPWGSWWGHHVHAQPVCETCPPVVGVGEGAWYWVRSPEQEKQVVISLYTRYCLRCHGVDGRGVWDIPGVPNFADPRFQTAHPD